MISLRSIRQFLVIGLVAIGATCSGIDLYAQQGSVSPPPAKETRQQQGGGLTPPPKPQAPQAKVSENNELGSPFVLGERLVFNVSYLNFPTAARLEMEVADQGQFFGQESYQIRTKVQTMGQVRSLFAVIDNQYISYITPGTAIPIRVVNILRQGAMQSEETIVLDQTERQATFPDGVRLPI
ncbi:MAG: DUF3108 domain-containing protein, partial [Blastocatellia bacterium]|nr:DUF3108 domain-containing protein [Blastocatellia bacterium]